MKPYSTTGIGRDFLVFVFLPFIVWVFCFWDFLSGRLAFVVDAISYYQQIDFFTDHIIRGVYPLWDPTWFNGAPYNFFLRRMGEVNPFYWIAGGLKAFGVANIHAYLVFLAAYFLLAVTGFWLIVRLLIRDRLAATAACWVLLFSGWGTQLFYNYIIILFVPLVWFFYFLFTFAIEKKRHQFLGICFALALAVTTYIPFFFLTIVVLFMILFPVFDARRTIGFLKDTFVFMRANRIFTAACLMFLLVACVPAVDFYKESRQGEFVLPGRHDASAGVSAVAVSAKSVKVGDLMAQGYFDKTFADHPRLILGDFFVSYFLFLVFLAIVIVPMTWRAGFLLANILILVAIGMTEATPLYQFLYDKVFFFRYMRMLFYFFWLAALPMMIFLAMDRLAVFIKQWYGKKDIRVTIFMITAHMIFGVWASTREGAGWTAAPAVLLSLAFFLLVLKGASREKVLLPLLAAAILVYPLEAVHYISDNAAINGPDDRKRILLNKEFCLQTPVRPSLIDEDNKDPFLKQMQSGLYYASRWYADVHTYSGRNEREAFIANKLYLFDNTALVQTGSEGFFRKLGEKWRSRTNVALLGTEVPPTDLRRQDGGGMAYVVGSEDPMIKVVAFDANTLKVVADLPRPKFLLWTDNYHSGWHVFINGKEDRLLRADHAFKGVWLPAGKSDVVFRFATPWRYLAAYGIMLIFLVALVALLVLVRREGLTKGAGDDEN